MTTYKFIENILFYGALLCLIYLLAVTGTLFIILKLLTEYVQTA